MPSVLEKAPSNRAPLQSSPLENIDFDRNSPGSTSVSSRRVSFLRRLLSS